MFFGMRSEENRPSNWYEIIKNDDFGSMSYTQFREAMEASIGNFVRYIMQIVPHNIPDFLSGNAAANPM